MKKRPNDINQLAKMLVEISTGQIDDIEQVKSKKPKKSNKKKKEDSKSKSK